MKYISYFLLVLVVIMAFFPSVYESYLKLTADSTMYYSEISHDKAHRADAFFTNKLPLRIYNMYTYRFIRVYDNKTGKFLRESNLCTSAGLVMSFRNDEVCYGNVSGIQGKGLFGYTNECIVKIK